MYFDTQRIEERVRVAEVGRPYRLPADPGITAVEAGRAWGTITQRARGCLRQTIHDCARCRGT